MMRKSFFCERTDVPQIMPTSTLQASAVTRGASQQMDRISILQSPREQLKRLEVLRGIMFSTGIQSGQTSPRNSLNQTQQTQTTTQA